MCSKSGEFWVPQITDIIHSITSNIAYLLSCTKPAGHVPPPYCHDFHRFSAFFFLSPKRPLIQLHSTMTCFHIPYLILSHVPFLLSYLSSSFGHFGQKGKLGHLGLLRLETFGPWEDSTEDYLFWSDIDVPYKGVDPSLGSLLCLGH